MNRREFRYTTLWTEEDENIIFAEYSEKLAIDLKIAEELIQNRIEFSKGENVYYLIDLGNIKSVSREARDYMSKPEGLKGIKAGAFITNKPLTTVLINFFLVINKPAVPAKFFTNKEDALNWIRKLQEEN